MKKQELTFRQNLVKLMGGRWIPSIHVENRLNPGVPDLSYVMYGAGHETGWLELKATTRSAMKFEVEQSQHQWMFKHAHRVPAHFLIEVKAGPRSVYYLVSGTRHNELGEAKSEAEVQALSSAMYQVPADDNGIWIVTWLSNQLSIETRRVFR